LCRPVTPDDLPIVGNLTGFKNVYLHNGMGGFGNASVGTAKLLADMITED
jgi:glycine/D-amino acid oxidase-like deaminating enzyme